LAHQVVEEAADPGGAHTQRLSRKTPKEVPLGQPDMARRC
jgi:hypothetical protein